MILLAIVVLLAVPVCAADDVPCIILAKPDVIYELRLDAKTANQTYFVTFTFNYSLDSGDRLHLEENQPTYNVRYDSGNYTIKLGNTELCTICDEGVDTLLLGESCARLRVTSSDYFVRLANMQTTETGIKAFELPESLRMIVAVCSLLPFFLLIPDAVEELQVQLEVEATKSGVYGHLFSLLLPLLSVAVTLVLLQTLDVWVVWI